MRIPKPTWSAGTAGAWFPLAIFAAHTLAGTAVAIADQLATREARRA